MLSSYVSSSVQRTQFGFFYFALFVRFSSKIGDTKLFQMLSVGTLIHHLFKGLVKQHNHMLLTIVNWL